MPHSANIAYEVALPPEIWLHIAQFLPRASHFRLYGLNRMFYELYMDEKYKAITFGAIDKGFLHDLDSLKNKNISERVRSFSIIPDFIEEQFLDEQDQPSMFESGTSKVPLGLKLKKIAKNVLHKPRSSKKSGPEYHRSLISYLRTSSETIRKLSLVIPNLTGIEHYTIHWTCATVLHASSYLGIAWATFGNLLSLELQVSLKRLADVLPISTIQLPNLSTLTIRLVPPSIWAPDIEQHTTVNERSIAKLEIFINSLHTSLKEFNFHAFTKASFDSIFFDSLQLDRLTTFRLDTCLNNYSILPDTISTPIEFINHHSKTIRHLTLWSTTDYPICRFQISSLQAVSLVSFSTSVQILFNSWDESSIFLRRTAQSLLILSISQALYPEQFGKLLNAVAHTPEHSNGIMDLSIEILDFSMDVIEILSTKMFRLRRLNLHIHYVQVEGTDFLKPGEFFPFKSAKGSRTDIYSFQGSSGEKKYEIKLQDIAVTRRSCCGTLYLWGLMEFIAQSIPSVHSFVGRGNMEIPDPSNVKPKTGGMDVGCSFGTS
ncbi:hypothetical protein BDQ12DRAFT_720539 [Crucibulum laeve]|uniref:F-box domain-containing protein n=1 Tax=Crucibulum laeve TaxID=68775 RepID=A0A5C3MAE1_9AGAR|nr:hypothetical protein BDQ12DRAFT_720539 [Crucibulum laeve]